MGGVALRAVNNSDVPATSPVRSRDLKLAVWVRVRHRLACREG